MANIRANLVTFAKAQTGLIPLIADRVHFINRPQDSGNLTSLVVRCIDGKQGAVMGADEEDGAGDDGTRSRQFEFVVWAASLEKCWEVGDVLMGLLHGTGGYACGDMTIGSSWYVREYDGDRLLDGYSDAGMYAITYVFDFLFIG